VLVSAWAFPAGVPTASAKASASAEVSAVLQFMSWSFLDESGFQVTVDSATQSRREK
jgi:hypothetical protein